MFPCSLTCSCYFFHADTCGDPLNKGLAAAASDNMSKEACIVSSDRELKLC